VQGLVLEEGTWSGKPARSAHVRFSCAEEGDEVLHGIESRPNGLVYCGQYISTVPDRVAPRNVKNSISNMSYIKDQVDKTPSSPSLMGFVLNPTLPTLGSVDNQFINSFAGTNASPDSAVAMNDHQSVSGIGSFTAKDHLIDGFAGTMASLGSAAMNDHQSVSDVGSFTAKDQLSDGFAGTMASLGSAAMNDHQSVSDIGSFTAKDHLIDGFAGTMASLDSAAMNDHQSVSDIGSFTAKDQWEDEFEDELWAGISHDPNLQV
jgi:hypothetical protein